MSSNLYMYVQKYTCTRTYMYTHAHTCTETQSIYIYIKLKDGNEGEHRPLISNWYSFYNIWPLLSPTSAPQALKVAAIRAPYALLANRALPAALPTDKFQRDWYTLWKTQAGWGTAANPLGGSVQQTLYQSMPRA